MPQISGLVAGGNIKPAVFVTETGQYTVVEAATTDTKPPIGVSPEYNRYPTGTPWDNGFVATAGQDLRVYEQGEDCMIQTGNTAITGGDYLMADANGYAIPVTTGHYYGAQAFESSSGSGVRIRCRVISGWKN